MAKVLDGPQDKNEVYAFHMAMAHELADDALDNGDVQPGHPVVNEIVMHKLAALLTGGNWSSKLNPEPPTKQV